MTHTNLKAFLQIKMEIELESWRNGEKQWNVSNQFSESVLESALENFHNIDALIEQWGKQGTNLQAVAVMDWAYALSDFQPSDIESAWID